MIFVYPVEEVIRIRTGERGHEALMYPAISMRGEPRAASSSKVPPRYDGDYGQRLLPEGSRRWLPLFSAPCWA